MCLLKCLQLKPFSSTERAIRVEPRMTAYHRCCECGGRNIGLSFSAPLLIAVRFLATPLRTHRDTRQATDISLPAAMAGGRVGGGIMIDSFMIIPNIPCDQ